MWNCVLFLPDVVTGNQRARMSHPMHLHGYDQYLIDQGIFKTTNIQQELGDLLERLQYNENIPDKPIMKDTYLVPSGGYIVIRIIADNPGKLIGLFHHHFHSSFTSSVRFGTQL